MEYGKEKARKNRKNIIDIEVFLKVCEDKCAECFFFENF